MRGVLTEAVQRDHVRMVPCPSVSIFFRDKHTRHVGKIPVKTRRTTYYGKLSVPTESVQQIALCKHAF
jgi:hypothetical protein